MDYKYIEQLLERYWQCDTSVEEEAQLREFFASGEVPDGLLRYRDLFLYQKVQQETRLDSDFDARLLKRIAQAEMREVKARPITWMSRFAPLLKAAAVIAVVLMLGNVAQRSVPGSEERVLGTDTIGRQVTAPSVAISTNADEKALPDSLTKNPKPELLKK